MTRLSDNTLGELEAAAREAGFDYPIAWALRFLSGNYGTLRSALEGAGDPWRARELTELVKTIRAEVGEDGGRQHWIVVYYNETDDEIKSYEIENRTEKEAENEVIADVTQRSDVKDWTLEPLYIGEDH